MASRLDALFCDICRWAQAHGVSVSERPFESDKAGEFNGIAVTMNESYAAEEKAYYLLHALGSIVLWALDKNAVQAMFDDLRIAKKEPDRVRLEASIDRYRTFETESSELAVWLLAKLGHREVVPAYTNFMRADLEALTIYHRTGKAPVWREFFALWNREVSTGRRTVMPFHPREISTFVPCVIERQEILQNNAA